MQQVSNVNGCARAYSHTRAQFGFQPESITRPAVTTPTVDAPAMRNAEAAL